LSYNRGGTRFRKSSVNYTAFPTPSRRQSMTSESNTSPIRSPIIKDALNMKRQTMIVEGSAKAPSLEGVVDLKNSVGTDVFHETLPGSYPRSTMSRNSVVTPASSFTAPYLSPLHLVTPHDITLLPSFPPTNWPLNPSPTQPAFRSSQYIHQK
jgi:hypothetical protein